MSERFIRLIPEDPTYVPSAADQQAAAQLLSRLLPDTREITTEVHDEVVFVDQGELFETIACPACDSPIQIDWWQDAMDEAYESRFSNLLVVTPCCDATVSLNDLRYKLYFSLSAGHPGDRSCRVRLLRPGLAGGTTGCRRQCTRS